MKLSGSNPGESLERDDYLCVDGFMRTIVDARALKTAFELRLIDRLLENQIMSFERLERELKLDHHGLHLLLDMLSANQVIARVGEKISLAECFVDAMAYRDLMEAKLDFAGYLATDFLEGFTLLLASPEAFKKQARLFQLFDYRRCLEFTNDNYRRTKAWMRLTTMLTKYESSTCLRFHDFSGYKQALDIGGNSGEFMLRLCKAYPEMRATVMDLPLVCQAGQEHISQEPEAERIVFLKADVTKDPIPRGFDLITFKSMLHDWPEEDIKNFLAKAADALNPDGTLLIFERGPVPATGKTIPFSMIPILLFFRSYRPSAFYVNQLEALGLQEIETRHFNLDSPFFLVTAKKCSA